MSAQSVLAGEDLDEPAEEVLDPALVVFPIVTPKDMSVAADKQEEDGYLHRRVYAPVMVK